MSKYVVQYLATNRYGGLEDRETTIRATSAAEAIAAVAAKHPNAHVHYAELVA